jgi:WD40 repeat protein
MEIFRPGKAKVEYSPSGPFGPAWQFPIWMLIGVLCVACGGPGSNGSADVLGSRVATIPTPESGLDTWAARFSPDGTRIVLGSFYQQFDVWEWRAKRKEATLSLPRGANPSAVINAVDFSNDGRYLAVATAGAGEIAVRIFDSRDWSVAADVLDSSPGGVTALEFAPGGSQLIFVKDGDGTKGENLFAYDVHSRQMSWSLALPKFVPSSISVSPDGNWAAVEGGAFLPPPPESMDTNERLKRGFLRLQMQIIQLPKANVSKILEPHVSGRLVWSSDGTRIAVAGAGATEILMFPSGESLDIDRQSGTGHLTASFSPDGRYFIQGDMNGKGTGQGLFIWDANRKHLLEHVSGNISSIDMTRDSRFLAVGGRDKTTIYPLK